MTPDNQLTVFEKARVAAEEAAHASTERLEKTHKALIEQPIWLGVLGGAATGGAVTLWTLPTGDATFRWGTGHLALLVGTAISAVVFLILYFALRRHATHAASSTRLSPTELYLALDSERSEVKQLTSMLLGERAIANSLAQWSFTIEGAQQGLVNFVRSVQNHEMARRLQSEKSAVLKGEIEAAFSDLVQEILGNLVSQRRSLLEYPPDATYFIELFEMQGDRLRPLVCRHTPGAVNHERTWGLQEGPVGSAVAAGTAKHIHDLNVVVDLHQDRRPSDSETIRSTIVAPLQAVDERAHQCHGALFISSSVPKQFTAQHAVFVKILANVLSGMFYARENAHRRLDDVKRRQGHSD